MAISTIGTDALAASAVTTTKLASGVPSRSQLPAGTVLQVVSATYSTEVSTTSSSFVTTGLTASITPTSATSKIFVIANTASRQNTYYGQSMFALFRGTATGLNLSGSTVGMQQNYSYGSSTTGNSTIGICVSYLDSPATTSATSYTLGFRVDGGTGYAQQQNSMGSITLMEIAA